MSNLETMLALLHEIDPQAGEYVQWLLDNPDEYEVVSIWPLSASRDKLERHFSTHPTVGYLFVFDKTEQGVSYWDHIDAQLRARWKAWFGS